MFALTLLALSRHRRKHSLFNGLLEGDPIAWAFLAGIIAILIVVAYLKNKSHQQLARASQGRE